MHIPQSLINLLRQAVERQASDLHLMAGIPPSVRIDGDIEFLDDDPLGADELGPMLLGLASEGQAAQLDSTRDVSFSVAVPDLGRFRVALYYQRGHVEASVRLVPAQVRALDDMGLPTIVQALAGRTSGLVLITGPAGAGKTTLLNSMVDWINAQRRARIIMIEDPVEYVHANKRSVVIQREVDADAHSFQSALMAALRQDPNVICVGEIRSLDTISTALTAAETGHLVLGTLHTQGAAQTVERIVDAFPTGQHNQVRQQLAGTLQGVVSLQLLPRMAQSGRILAYEVMVGTPAVRNLIRNGKLEQLPAMIQTGGEDGMNPMDRCLRTYYEQGIISYETALSRAHNANEFRGLRAAPTPV